MRFSQGLTTLVSVLCLFLSHVDAWTNPIRKPSGSDPFLVYSGDGYYYLLTTTWTDVQISRSTTITGLKASPERKTVFSTTTASMCCNVWSPEAHYLGNKWYIYFTAGDANNLDGQRLHVLTGGATPWDTYTYSGQLTTEWSIDASVLRFSTWGTWLMFSCLHGVSHQSICLQKLSSSYTSLTGTIRVISSPTEAFELVGAPVNEAPAALYFNGATYVSYAASYCWTASYCIGLLEWDGATDPGEAAAWTKADGCVFASANGHYGPASNGWFQSPDGTQTWLVYHATDSAAGACDDSRYTMVQLLGTHSDGSPEFGSPVGFSHVYSEPSGK